MRRIAVGVTKALSLGSLLIAGCTQADLAVVKLLPEPPVHSLPARPKRPLEQKQPPKVVERKVRRGSGEPGWMPPGGISKRWECIVLHHSATRGGGAGDFHHAHQNRGWDELGYHFVIGNGTGSGDGQVEVGSRWYKQKHGAHCKTRGNYHNEHGIGICLVGNFEGRPPTARQMASLRKLLGFLVAKTGIPASRVIGHREAPGTNTKCPGRYMPMAQIRSNLRSHFVASGF